MKAKTTTSTTFSRQAAIRFDLISQTGVRSSTSQLGTLVTGFKSGTDSSISSGTSKSGAFTPCVHTRSEYVQLANIRNVVNFHTAPSSGFYANAMGFGCGEDSYNRKYSSVIGQTASNHKVLNDNAFTAFNWKTYYDKALLEMLPSFDGGDNSLVNFLVELKDFRYLARRLASASLGSARSVLSAIADGGFGLSARNGTVKNLSSVYLANEFAWKPFIRDIVSLYQTFASFEARFADVISRAGKPQQRYYGTTVTGTSVAETYVDAAGDNVSMPGTGWRLPSFYVRGHVLPSPGARYHATVRYRYPLPPELKTASGRVKALLDALGVNRNPSIIWNAIPFTFLVDWLVNVSRFLEQFKTTNIVFQTEILDFCHSVKFQRRIVGEMNTWSKRGSTALQSGYVAFDQITHTRYERKVGLMPGFPGALQTSGLSPREIALSGALIGANYRKK
ncbi:maturation protein [ssRNA phage SRR7976301_10]|uniref:Maturation protein n=1 Tax=ssRNA phage SRR7976301_10 TaxID=2786660 RepID=A0A8S5L5T8_9VIRU|nr:maturation protein [ssRNA phage SRR7976301_10]DAD52690.1 TPA_asm: maturation protein [ssRNA phage SRR7976301_10]